MSSEESAAPGLAARLFGRSKKPDGGGGHSRTPTWSMGILNDPETIEVPGSVLLLASHRNEPLGLRNVHARTSHSSIPAGFPVDIPMTPGGTRPLPHHHRSGAEAETEAEAEAERRRKEDETAAKKKTADGQIILEPQPDDSANDPLNWPSWKRDCALLSLGIYCMVGGGITPLIAAGFTDVADTYDVTVEDVALTTGLFMMGMGVGSVIFSPTAILWGKRPVYLFSAVIFIGTSLWAGFSPSFHSLLAARVFQGIAVSPVECLPSATIAEIFFLHERAYRIGIYTLLLLGGKNLVPLVSAAVIGRFGWRWAFWIIAMVVGLCGVLLFIFVPETFWDRTPTREPKKRPSFLRRLSSRQAHHHHTDPATTKTQTTLGSAPHPEGEETGRPASPGISTRARELHVGFAGAAANKEAGTQEEQQQPQDSAAAPAAAHGEMAPPAQQPRTATGSESGGTSNLVDYFSSDGGGGGGGGADLDDEKITESELRAPPKAKAYTHNLRHLPAQTITQQLKPFHGRLNNDRWLKVMVRPFILFAYPAVLWSAIVYSLSIGWLIVISENMAAIYRDPTRYNFTALQTGLVYVSPFIGGVLGTGVAGRVSDVIVRAMSRRNGGMYEPEFRLVMAAPVLITTCVGLMGFGWSAQEGDHWIVPTVFFGIVSFGCSLGSTTSITFCVDSYRQYAGEALVTLNFSKNIFHGLVFSLFISHWLKDDGPRNVFIWIGIIQLIFMLLSVPMYIFGKRARMWTVRKNFMEKF
ncbi:Major Facilitator Superfamily [Geosmithia morbida]|uniref:Major Facilitator Superfamily n=1 Tax=Geosmithia morbida TaxID=1094350 RepID=A0A9P4YZQ2_9HYPO|nr:Major Facilitator Superfamily [Geosmithia morbida]KAF4124603.1 Major Facilitator Superfamily [Geosmithia morbida]